MQLINVFFGGTLIQDILDDNPSRNNHLKLSSHKININNKTLLSSIFKLKSATTIFNIYICLDFFNEICLKFNDCTRGKIEHLRP